MANIYKSNYTGEQIDNSVGLTQENTATQGQVLTANGTGGASWQNASVGTEVVANPTSGATEELSKLQVGSNVYSIPKGTEVVANPTLSGSEVSLTGLEVSGTKYKVSAGGTQMYMHSITFIKEGASSDCFGSVTVHIINNSSTKYTSIDSITFPEMTASGVVFNNGIMGVVSKAYKQSSKNKTIGFYYRNVWNLASSSHSTGGGGSYFIADNWSGDTVQAL